MPTLLSPAQIQQVKRLAAEGRRTREISRLMGICESSVHKARQGRLDHRLRGDPQLDEPDHRIPVWCRRCRCHVYLPCQTCRLKEHEERHVRRGVVRRFVPLPAGVRKPQVLKRLQLSVAEIGLPLRLVNHLQQRNILTVNDVLHCTREELLSSPNFGELSLQRLYRCLKRLGFRSRRHAQSRRKTRIAS